MSGDKHAGEDFVRDGTWEELADIAAAENRFVKPEPKFRREWMRLLD